MVKGYESVAGQPAWQSMRNMKTHPKDAVLPDGLVMTGNEFLRNIVDYRDPKAKLFTFRNLPFDHYKSDDNVLWHHGLPLLTGLRKQGQTETIGEWASWQALGFDGKSVVGDPLFVGRDKDDYRLRPESPALKLGFQPIPIEKIGPYADDLRASWPIVEAEGAREKPLTPLGLGMPKGVGQPADAAALVTAVECRPRGGLPNFFAKAKAGGDVRVAYLGGSITAAPGWRVFSLDRLKKDFPTAHFSEISAAIGGTGSDLGAFRVGHDVIAHKPDLVFVEFAVNDGGAAPEQILATMEGIVRQILRANPATDICFVYTVSEPFLPDLAKGVFPRAASTMEAVADHYAIPSVHYGVEVNRRIADGSLVFKGEKPEKLDAAATPLLFSSDGVHPHVETGHRLYADVLARSLATIQAAATTAAPHQLPEPLRADNWEKAKMIPVEHSMLRGDWRRVTPADDERAKAFAARMPVLWKAEKPGAELVVAFTGTRLAVYDLLGPGEGIVSLRIDDAAAKNVPRIDGYSTYWRIGTLNTGSQPVGTHRVTIRLEEAAPDKAKILFEHNRPDLEKNPAKYVENAWYASAILLLGDLLPADAGPAK